MAGRRRTESRARKDAEPKPPPAAWAGKTLVVLRGGPRDGSWVFAEDFARGPDADDPRSIVYGYTRTDAFEQHPDYPVMGRVWRHV